MSTPFAAHTRIDYVDIRLERLEEQVNELVKHSLKQPRQPSATPIAEQLTNFIINMHALSLDISYAANDMVEHCQELKKEITPEEEVLFDEPE